jgi:undecaprenyl diphosphate synthase
MPLTSHPPPDGLHLAVIPDGNGRWAAARGLPRSAGHRAGLEAVQRIERAARGLGIGTLTLFAFSADNWERPSDEVRGILRLVQQYLANSLQEWVERGVRVRVLGRRDRLPPALRQGIEAAEAVTRDGRRLDLRLAVDYSSRAALLRAACRLYTSLEVSEAAFARMLADGAPEVDLLIRTGGEQRLSDFLLWEGAYAELYFTPKMWPEFTAADLARALGEYHARERRFGRLPQAAAS